MSPAALILAVAAVLTAVAVLTLACARAGTRRDRDECRWCRYWAVVECSCPAPCKAPHCGAREVRR